MATLQGLRQRTWPTWGDQEEWVEVQSILHQLWHFVQVKTIFGKQGEQAALPQCDRLMFKNCCMHGNTFQSRRRFAYYSNCNRVVKVKANDRHWGGHRSSCYTCPLPPAWVPWCLFSCRQIQQGKQDMDTQEACGYPWRKPIPSSLYPCHHWVRYHISTIWYWKSGSIQENYEVTRNETPSCCVLWNKRQKCR